MTITTFNKVDGRLGWDEMDVNGLYWGGTGIKEPRFGRHTTSPEETLQTALQWAVEAIRQGHTGCVLRMCIR